MWDVYVYVSWHRTFAMNMKLLYNAHIETIHNLIIQFLGPSHDSFTWDSLSQVPSAMENSLK